MFPARYAEVIAVGAIDSFGKKAPFCNEDPQNDPTDFLAPGKNVFSTDVGGGYGLCSGTSMAVPHITAAVVLMKGLNRSLTPDQIRNVLKETSILDSREVDLEAALSLAEY